MSMRRLIDRLQEGNDDEKPVYVLFTIRKGAGAIITRRPDQDKDHFYGAWYSMSKVKDAAVKIAKETGDFVQVYKIYVVKSEWPAAKAKYFDRRGDDWNYDVVKNEGDLVLSGLAGY